MAVIMDTLSAGKVLDYVHVILKHSTLQRGLQSLPLLPQRITPTLLYTSQQASGHRNRQQRVALRSIHLGRFSIRSTQHCPFYQLYGQSVLPSCARDTKPDQVLWSTLVSAVLMKGTEVQTLSVPGSRL